jgi:signal transduction histidine kinase
LERQQIELKQLNASKDKFFSIIAHDLRNPFTGLLGITDFIVKNIEKFTQVEVKEHVAELRDSAETVYTLIENLLAWSRLQRGAMEYCPQHILLDKIAESNVRLFTPTAKQKQITLSNQVSEGITAYADQDMIDTVVRNLTSNALKFTYPKGIVTISARQREHVVEIAVSDTGIGIPPEELSQLFRIDIKYSNAGTAGEEGTGLGLILCKDLIEKNGGMIRVESEVGQGTVFTFGLPAKQGIQEF